MNSGNKDYIYLQPICLIIYIKNRAVKIWFLFFSVKFMPSPNHFWGRFLWANSHCNCNCNDCKCSSSSSSGDNCNCIGIKLNPTQVIMQTRVPRFGCAFFSVPGRNLRLHLHLHLDQLRPENPVRNKTAS